MTHKATQALLKLVNATTAMHEAQMELIDVLSAEGHINEDEQPLPESRDVCRGPVPDSHAYWRGNCTATSWF